jgi:hypothetical protein
MTGLLTNYMRFQGSLADRPSEQEMVALRLQARALAEQVEDERTLASYLAADGFFPFWLRGLDRPATREEIATATASAKRALEIARRLDDPNLQSMALDALGGSDPDDWRGGLEHATERLTFQDRLEMLEKLDAYGMVAWTSSLLGELEQADRVTAEGLAQVQPGQVPGPTLHLTAWRIYALTLLCRWDEGLVIADRAYALWLDLGRPSTGYALHGFMAAIDIARARQNQQLVDRYASVYEEITSSYQEGAHYRLWQGYAGHDIAPIARAVDRFKLGQWFRIDHFERGLSRLLDQDQVPSASRIATILDYSRSRELAFVEAQADRALGLANRNVEALERSINLFDRFGALPYAARVRCERALITGDQTEKKAGLEVLERLGDLEQILRFERLQVG